ncbi:PadR family transcriptional regulator [Lacticaseibacillus absianus]|uniref:PadR family transcriptional regulator n=1 Tax=Lacticaseibacillus absianus TaxID=2729623 RepID=UPI0015CB4E8C|nr:PadR family transcriptional regulator [Lacticaseibacillus absianus]
MDSQMKKGLIEYSVLAALARGDSYGYRIIKDCPPVLELTLSTLYPILRRMETDGRVSTYQQTHNGRARKYYRLTTAGRASMRAFVSDWQDVETVYHQIEAAAAQLPELEGPNR